MLASESPSAGAGDRSASRKVNVTPEDIYVCLLNTQDVGWSLTNVVIYSINHHSGSHKAAPRVYLVLPFHLLLYSL